jgi:uncharacterized membrane protein YfcA
VSLCVFRAPLRWWWFIDDTNLIMVFGIPPTTVGTDLLYAAFTKMGGIYVHHKKKNINWTITAGYH